MGGRGRGNVRKWWLPALCLLAVLVMTGPALAAEQPTVRVGLAEGVNLAEFRVTLGSYRLVDAATGLTVAEPAPGEKWSVAREGGILRLAREGTPWPAPLSGPLLLQPVDASGLSLFRFRNVQYRGSLAIQDEPAGLLVVNTLPLEAYLYGVVGREMGASAPREALLAQAVVSRTYAFSRLGTSLRYDVGTDTGTQVYGGYDGETEGVREAVDATAGEVIYFEGRPILAFFHANAGGYTEKSENVWVEALPYLQPVPSPQDESALRYPAQTATGWPASSYRWERALTRQELEQKVAAWGNGQGRGVGEVQDLLAFAVERDGVTPTASGRVTEVRVVGAAGSLSVFRDSIRSLLGLPSTLFSLTTDAEVYLLQSAGGPAVRVGGGQGLVAVGGSGEVLPLNGAEPRYAVLGAGGERTLAKKLQNVFFSGRGQGHGVGMSQWGARGMAEEGYTYRDIIEHYYNQDHKDGRLVIKNAYPASGK